MSTSNFEGGVGKARLAACPLVGPAAVEYGSPVMQRCSLTNFAHLHRQRSQAFDASAFQSNAGGANKRPGGVDRALGKTDPWGDRVGKRTQLLLFFSISAPSARKIFRKNGPKRFITVRQRSPQVVCGEGLS